MSITRSDSAIAVRAAGILGYPADVIERFLYKSYGHRFDFFALTPNGMLRVAALSSIIWSGAITLVWLAIRPRFAPSTFARISLIARGIAQPVLALLLTWIFFAPLGGMFHIVICGMLGPIVLSGEGAEPGDLVAGGYAVHFFMGRFILSIVLWILALLFIFRLLRAREAPNAA